MFFCAEERENVIDFDPRVKVFMLITSNIIMINIRSDGMKLYVKFIMFGVIILLLMLGQRRKVAAMGLILFAAGWSLELMGHIDKINGLIGFLAAICNAMIIRMYPCVLAEYYVIATTKVSKLIEGFRKLKVPEQINLPLAVIFRFIPTVAEESVLIQNAMKMRDVRIKKGISLLKLLEYKYIPLMMMTVKIGDELTVSALTKGLSIENDRTCIYQLKFTFYDYALIVILALLVVLFMRG